MNYLNSIEIYNFRGFDKLEIEEFNHINLLIGKNNSGKSSILEAIFLLIGMSNPVLTSSINQIRGLQLKKASDFKYLFYKLKLENQPEFSGAFSDFVTRKLKLKPIFNTEIVTTNHKQSIVNNELALGASNAAPQISGIELEFSLKKTNIQNKTYKSSIVFTPTEIVNNINKSYKEEIQAVYITSNSNETSTLARYSEIVKRKKGEIILEALQKIDPKIESIQALPDGLYFSYSDIDELIPINIAGDGVRKFLNIVTAIAEWNNSIVLIDEIENGLHFSAHKLLWESILTISKEFNVQLFISTHNIETLKCLKELLELTMYAEFQNKVNVYSVSHTQKSGIKTYKYSFEGFKDAIETETEIR